MKIIEFGAMWCAGCLVMERRINRIKEQYPEVEFIKMDIDNNKEEFSQYEIGKKIPVYVFLKEEVEVSRLIGEKTEKEFRKEIEKVK